MFEHWLPKNNLQRRSFSLFNNNTHQKLLQILNSHYQKPIGAIARASGQDAPLVPLSKAHKRPQGVLNVWSHGSKLKISKPKTQILSKHFYGLRSQISEFSRSSRRRLIGRMSEIDKRADLPYFITLTYGEVYPQPKQAKKDMKRLIQRIRRSYPSFCSFWKLEPQKRGAPHFHLLAWGLTGYPHDILIFIVKNWHEIAGSGDQNHILFHLGCLPGSAPCVSKVRSWRGVMSYASKYLGKVIETADDNWGEPGRFWGIVYRLDLPWADLVTVFIDNGQAIKLIRLLRRAIRAKSRDYKSLTGFVNNPDYWLSNWLQMSS